MAAAAQAAQERPCLPHREAGPFLCLHHMESAARRASVRPVQRNRMESAARRVPVRPVLRQSHGKHMAARHVPLRPVQRNRMESAARRASVRPVLRQSYGKCMAERRIPVRPVQRQFHGKRMAVRRIPVRPVLRQSHGKRMVALPRFRAACSASIPWKAHGMRNGHSSRGQNMFMDFRSRYLAICAGKQYNEAM